MINLAYDLHIHSCLSPCADANMTPVNIAGMAHVKGLDVVALTDHNSCKNCEPFIKHCNEYGILAIPGMEITTSEEVHVLCLFPSIEDAKEFDGLIYEHLNKIINNETIFGQQIIYNDQDQWVEKEKYLLINSTAISFNELYSLVDHYHGVMIPAHIDKEANSLITNLGFVEEESQYSCIEVKNKLIFEKMKKLYNLEHFKVIYNSDAHYLEEISEPINFIKVKQKSVTEVLNVLKYVQ